MAQKRTLITSLLEECWPQPDEPVLFLAPWCQATTRKDYWQQFDFEVVPYHWDDRAKVYQDHQYLTELIDVLLEQLTVILNKLHGVNQTSRFWRILLGPWLINFVPDVFDRYQCVVGALARDDIEKAIVHTIDDNVFVPLELDQFIVFQEHALWNEYLVRRLLQFNGFDRFEYLPEDDQITVPRKPLELTVGLKAKVKKLILNAAKVLTPNKGYFIVSSYMNKPDYVKLQLRLGQLPLLHQGEPCKDVELDPSFRQWRLPQDNTDSPFEAQLKQLLVEQMPKAYLEGFKYLRERGQQMGWPKQPKLIWTSNAHHRDDMFKLWVGEKVDSGVPFILGQHGGHYGQGLYSMPEDHEMKICDHYLSWGWKTNEKVIPVGILKKVEEQDKSSRRQNAVLVLALAPPYAGATISIPVGPVVKEYMKEQVDFYGQLDKAVASQMDVRLYPRDYGWDQSGYFTSRFPDVTIDDGKINYYDMLANAKLVVVGWNATTYLESMASDVPTVTFWDERYFEIHDQANEYFDVLRKVGLHHDTAASAAEHVNTIWHDIDGWWQSEEVVAARQTFLAEYAATVDLPKRLSEILRSIPKMTA